MPNVVSTVIRFISTFAGQGAEMAVKSIDGVRKAALIGTKGLAELGAAIGQASGKFGRMAREATNMMWSIQQLGALGGIMAGAQIFIDRIAEHFIAKADAMAEAAERMKERISDHLDRLNAARLNEVDKALKAATTDSDKAAAAFNAMANAYMKVANAGNGKLSAFESSEIADMELRKANEMAKAVATPDDMELRKANEMAKAESSSAVATPDDMELRKANEMANATPDDAPIVGAKADIAIGEKRLEQTVAATERRISIAGREESDARKRLSMSKDKEKAASEALAKAAEELKRTEDTDNRDIETLRQRKAKAEEAYAASVNARIMAEADAKAAVENEIKVRHESAAAVSSAKRSVVEAKVTLASLERAKAEKLAAEKEKKEAEKREKAEKDAEKARRDEVQKLKKHIQEESKRRSDLENALQDASQRVRETHDVFGRAAGMDQGGDLAANRQEAINESRYGKGRDALIGSGKITQGQDGVWRANGRLSNLNQAILDRLNTEQNKKNVEKEQDKVVQKLDELINKLELMSTL